MTPIGRMLVIIASNRWSPMWFDSAERPMNCRFVKPVSNTKFVAIANSIGFAQSSISSNAWRAAIATQQLL